MNGQSIGTDQLRGDMHTQGTTFLRPQEQARNDLVLVSHEVPVVTSDEVLP